MINQQLLDYIKQQTQQGVSKDEIKKSLLANGWNQNDLNEVFSLLEKGIPPVATSIPKSIPKVGSGSSKVLLFFIVLFIVAGGAFTAYKFGYLDSILNKEEVIVSDANLQETPVVPDLLADWQTYTNTEYGFSLNYPSNWHKLESVSNSPNLIVALSSKNPPQPGGSHSLNISTTQVKAPDQFQKSYNLYSNSHFGVTVTKLDVTISGVSPVYAMQVSLNNSETPPPITSLYYLFDHNDHFYKINITIPTADFDSEAKIVDQILSTFKFTDTSIATPNSLPPDPGEEGKKTLAGIDSDNDGVRDDMQIYISQTYPNSAKTRAALTQKIKTDQNFILNSKASDEVLFSIVTARNKAQDCLNYINKDPSAVLKIQKDMRAQFLNTKARSIAYVEADARLSGMFWPPPDRTKNNCDFDPDQLPN